MSDETSTSTSEIPIIEMLSVVALIDLQDTPLIGDLHNNPPTRDLHYSAKLSAEWEELL